MVVHWRRKNTADSNTVRARIAIVALGFLFFRPLSPVLAFFLCRVESSRLELWCDSSWTNPEIMIRIAEAVAEAPATAMSKSQELRKLSVQDQQQYLPIYLAKYRADI